MLIPKTVNGTPLTLTTLGELIKTPREGHKTEYRSYYENVKKEHGDTGSDGSHWVLMTRDMIAGSRSKSYADQTALVAKLGLGYQVPSVLDAAVCILMEHVDTGVRLFPNSPLTYTHCFEQIDRRWQVIVGGFGSAGLLVFNRIDNALIGVAALRMF